MAIVNDDRVNQESCSFTEWQPDLWNDTKNLGFHDQSRGKKKVEVNLPAERKINKQLSRHVNIMKSSQRVVYVIVYRHLS